MESVLCFFWVTRSPRDTSAASAITIPTTIPTRAAVESFWDEPEPVVLVDEPKPVTLADGLELVRLVDGLELVRLVDELELARLVDGLEPIWLVDEEGDPACAVCAMPAVDEGELGLRQEASFEGEGPTV